MGGLFLLIKSAIWILGLLFILIGIILIVFVKNKWKIKLLWISISLIISFIMLIFGIYIRQEYSFEKIYFSSSSSGRVRILYDQESGLVPIKNDNWSIIKVDTNHIVIIKREARRVITKFKFYLINNDGIEKEIESGYYPCDFKDKTMVMIDNPKNWNKYDVNIQDFTLMRKASDISSIIELKQLDSLSFAKLLECRKLIKK